MSNIGQFRNSQPQFTAHKVCSALTHRGIKLPKQVAGALDLLNYVESVQPRNEVDPEPITAAYLNREPADKIEVLSATIYAAGLRFSAWSQARDRAGRGVLEALRFNHEQLTTDLATLAAPLITAIEHAADLDTRNLDALVMAGRHDDARVMAELPATIAELNALYELRRATTPPGFRYDHKTVDCGQWEDPRPVRNVHASSVPDYYLNGTISGGKLWFPTVDEAATAARTIWTTDEQQRQAVESAAFHDRVRRFGAAHA
ncbi:hypothetical protein AB0F65_17620 [Nocardia rhamnosiphila]|uniref:hypothetical protein n=1 Tax=Nocardia rhamnosiphila TaxID=426716 RepID=UPI003403E8E0